MGKEVSSLTSEVTPLLILQPVAVFFVFRSKVLIVEEACLSCQLIDNLLLALAGIRVEVLVG